MKIILFTLFFILNTFKNDFIASPLLIVDDTIDITNYIISNLKKNNTIYLKNGIYSINKQIEITESNITISGESKENVKIIFISNKPSEEVLFKILGNSVKLENITFDGNHTDVYVSLIQIGNSYKKIITEDIQIKNCSFQNINGSIKGTDNAYAIRIFLNRSNNIIIKTSDFKHISAFDKDQKSGSGGGFCGGIFLFSDEPLESIQHVIKIKILKCLFDSIFTENSTKEGWDADGIRFYTNNSNPDSISKSVILIKNNSFYNVQKSGIKISGISGVKILNTSIYNNGPEMLCPIRIQWGKNIYVKNTRISGKFEYGFNIIGQNVVLKKIKSCPNSNYIISKKIINYQNNEIIENKNIKIINIK